ncbi:MAG: bifunctional diaminohydroxyphosphoribosylaminopyrimidine deaminase/5-amino-6-(5-phosphoribosylamino)uracil reductase RibD [Bacteroidia bacterium]|nr:bifunctional diaminohydroxyphosphoribosylaminopyrimidine deaminase/5-amino-6-(5-phosphoribosylamino)uracil reductase RibD [Bacteroidia bacterium]
MNHDYYMKEALNLARKGWPQVSPNPAVGCIIVQGDEIVASGYHEQFGGPHAEVNAINVLPENISPSECTLYVTLEPCSHFGKTPPCSDLIISKGFKTVVIACQDPNPLVSGMGINKLKKAGIEVITGVLEAEAAELNKHFMTFHKEKRPYIILKWALTEDGFISRTPVPASQELNNITGQKAKELVHKIRSETMAILVGKNTALADNPKLTTRLVKGRNPVRLLIDKNLGVPRSYNIYNEEAPIIIFNANKESTEAHVRFIKLDFNGEILPQLLRKLTDLNIQSVLVEGGASTINRFLEKDNWDEAIVFQNPDLFFGNGLKGPEFALKNTFELVGNDKLYHHFKNETMPVKEPENKEIF